MSKSESSPTRGSKVTFLLRDEHGERFRIGEVLGPVESDPITGERWVGIRMTDAKGEQTFSLIPMATILNVSPPERGAV